MYRLPIVIVLLAATLTGIQTARAGKGPAFRYVRVGHIGSKGGGLGQFPGIDGEGPSGVAVDQVCGDVYIADLGRKVVHHYDQNGKPIDEIGSPGTGRGQLEGPEGLFVGTGSTSPAG